MPAVFSRVKNWVNEVLSPADLDAEFNNILNNLDPTGVGSYSATVAQMKLTTDPGEVNTESLATSLGGELERLRFAIQEMKGSSAAQWYSTASTSLSELAAAIGTGLTSNRITSGLSSTLSSQPLFLVPNGSAKTVSVQGGTTNLVYSINGTSYTINSAVTSGTLTAAPNTQNTCTINDTRLSGQSWTAQLGEYGTTITVNSMGTSMTSLLGQIVGLKIVHGGNTEYCIGKIFSATQLTQVFRGFFFNSSSTAQERTVLSNGDTITLMKLTWVFAQTDGTLAVTYNNPRVSGTAPSSPSVGDYWLDTTVNIWKSYNSSSFVTANAIPIGICLQSTTATIAARSFDFFKNAADTNTALLEREDAATVRCQLRSPTISVYGTTVKFTEDWVRWDLTTDLASGLTEAASTTYYLYVTELGKSVIDTRPPHDRIDDRRGRYHPYETWRCVGQFYNNGSSNISGVIGYANYDSRDAYTIGGTCAASALTVTLNNMYGDPITPTAGATILVSDNTTSGTKWSRYINLPINIVVSSGSTLGHANGVANRIHVYLFDPQTTVNWDPLASYLGVGTIRYTSGELLNTSAEGGAGTATNATLIYSFTGLTNMPQRVLGRLTSTQATAGTWSTAPSEFLAGEALPPMLIMAAYQEANGMTVTTATIVNFNTKLDDNLNAVTTGASWKFTTPVNAYFQVNVATSLASATFTAGQTAHMYLYVNGTASLNMADFLVPINTTNTMYSLTGAALVRLNATDFIDIRYSAPGGSRALAANSSNVSIYLMNRW